MLKKTITYTDYNGKERTEDFYFNLTKAELAEMEITHRGGFANYLQDVIDAKDGRKIMDTFTDIIKMSYGVRSEDGRSFIKSEEEYMKFKGSEAYSVLFMELVTEGGKAAMFVNGIVPSGLAAEAAKIKAANGFRPGAETLPKSRRDALAAEEEAKQAENAEATFSEQVFTREEWERRRNEELQYHPPVVPVRLNTDPPYQPQTLGHPTMQDHPGDNLRLMTPDELERNGYPRDYNSTNQQ